MASPWLVAFFFGFTAVCQILGKETATIEIVPYLVYDDYNPSYNETMNTRINVTCTGSVTSEVCVFELNDGSYARWMRRPHNENSTKYKSMTPGDRYHLDGLGPTSCGITVYPPFEDSYGSGTWKCWMVYRHHAVVKAMVTRTDPMSTEIVEATAPVTEVIVKKGDDAKIECEAPYSIKFCFMRSPNGTVFAVTNGNVKSNNTFIKRLAINKDDLDVGICSAIIKKTDWTHHGNWTCQLDLVNAMNIETNITVNVQDTYLIGSFEKIDSKITLKCRKFPNFAANINDCHWVPPNGHGIYKTNTTEYSVTQNSKACTIQLKEWRKEYSGDWKCYSQFIDKSRNLFDVMETIVLPSMLPAEATSAPPSPPK